MDYDKHEHDDLPELTAEARHKLPPDEFKDAEREGEQAGRRAGTRESVRWTLVLVLVAGIVGSIAFDWMILIPTALLFLWYSIPYILAANSTAAEEAKTEVMHEHVIHPHSSATKAKRATPKSQPGEDADEFPSQAKERSTSRPPAP